MGLARRSELRQNAAGAWMWPDYGTPKVPSIVSWSRTAKIINKGCVIAADISSLARMIKNKRPRVPMILITKHPELLKQEVALPGAALCQPLEIAELCRAIKVRLAQ
jgi:hypothetical protein